ncbi:MAG: bacteriohemerythrin [Eubacteriales bacterium]
MAFKLNDDLRTGNNQIDEEHAELLRIINEFISSSSKGQEKQTQETLKFLVDYVKTHFSHEEVLQKQSNYPNYPKHTKIHRHLETAVLNAYKEFEKVGFSYQLSAVVIVRLGGCIMAHILSDDKELAKFLDQNK